MSVSLPLVSVATCSYNNARFVIETLDSIKAQTYPAIELVIVDDCSTDNSVALIEEWLKGYDSKYRFIKHEQNLGGSRPYNIALAATTGKYYAVIDSDDTMMPEKIARQVAMLEAAGDDVAAVYSDATLMDIESQPIEGMFVTRHRQFAQMPDGDVYAELLQGNYIPVPSLLIRREVIAGLGGYDESLIYGDYDMWLRLARHHKILYSDYVSACYRIRPGSLSNTIRNWEYTNARIFLKHVDGPLKASWLGDIAWTGYLKNDGDTMPVMRQIAAQRNEALLMVTYLLWRFGIADGQGGEIAYEARLLKERKGGVVDCRGKDDTDLFLEVIVPLLSTGVLKFILADGCANKNEAVGDLLAALPSRNIDLMRSLAFDAYAGGSGQVLLEAIWEAGGGSDRAVAMPCVFWRLGVDAAKGAMLLRELKGSAEHIGHAGVSHNGDDAAYFVAAVAPMLSLEQVKMLVASSLYQRNELMLPVVRALARQTGHRYITAALKLWKYRVNANTGGVILDRVDNYCKNKRNGLYIDLCVYKDIWGAIRSKAIV